MAKDNPGNTSRTKENSKLFIKCANANWELFPSKQKLMTFGEPGISFYLKTPVWVDSHFTIMIASSTLFGRLCSVSAKVVRVQVDTAGRRLVAPASTTERSFNSHSVQERVLKFLPSSGIYGVRIMNRRRTE